MIKILTISASPVEDSSTDILLMEMQRGVVENISNGDDVECVFVKLNDLDFMACQACGVAPDEGYCLFDDDLTDLYRDLEECDCLLMGSPIYFDTVSAQAKMFIDRCNCVRPPDWENADPEHDFLKLFQRKRPGAMVLVGGERGYFEGARRTIAGFFKWVEVVNCGHLMFHTDDFKLKGTAGDNADVIAEAHRMGKELAEKVMADKT